jgi:hypothetical protein
MFLRSVLGLAAAAAMCLGASLQAVSSFGSNPTKIQMYIYVPDKVAAKPAIIVAVWGDYSTPPTGTWAVRD